MKSAPVLEGETVYISGYNTPENDPGRQIAIEPFADVLARHDANHDGRISLAEAPDERTRKYFPFIDLDRDGAMDAHEWKLYAATMSAENGMLAFRIGGGQPIWKYQRAVPQLPSALLYRGVLWMINDSGVLTTLDPATGSMHKQGRLRGTADRYFASPVAADGKIFIVSHSGIVTVLKASPGQEILAVNDMESECYATPAIGDSRIFIRTRDALYSFGLPGR
jgi:outer membrane protein assembly factor BamB